GIQLESPADKRPFYRIDGLGLAGPAVQVAHRGRQGQDALLQAPVDSFERLLAEIPDVVGGDDRLKVGGEPSAPIREIESFVCEVQLDQTFVYQLREVDPIPAVADTPVYLVDHDACRGTLA